MSSSIFGSGSGSSGGGSSIFGSGSKKNQGDGGFLGTGIGPSLHSIYKGATSAPGKLADLAGGVATGLADTAYNAGGVGTNLLEAGMAKAAGDQNAANAYLSSAGRHLHGLGQQEVGMVTGASAALGDVANLPRLVPGVAQAEDAAGVNPGNLVRNTIGTGLADVGGIAAGKIHLNPLTPDNPQNVATLQQMGSTPGDFNQGTFQQRVKSGGYLNSVLGDVGNLALVSKGSTPALSAIAETADAAGHSGLASVAGTAADVSRAAEHPLKNSLGSNVVTPLTRAAFESRVGGQITDTGTNVADAPANGVESFNHDPVVAQYHDQYGRAHGAQFPGQVDTARTMPPEQGAALAQAYQSKPTDISQLSPEEQTATKAAYDKMIPEVQSQYDFLTKPEANGGMGVKVEVVNRADNPYAKTDGSTDFKKMLDDIQQNKHLYVDATSPTEAHPYMTPDQNNQFRAVHDAFGHSRAGNDFGPNGEEVAYQHHAQMFSPEAQRALAMETRGQNATLNFSPDNLARSEAGFPKQFDAQRVGLLPTEMSHPDYTKPPEAAFTPTIDHPEAVPAHSAGEVPNLPDNARTAEELSPTAKEYSARQAKPIPEWAKSAVGKLGDNSKIKAGLARLEDVKTSRTMRIVAREMQRGGVEMPVKVAAQEPFMRALTDGVKTLMDENKKLAPEDASRMIGQSVRDRLSGVEKFPTEGHHVLMPDAMRTPAIEAAINDAVSKYGDFAERTKQGLAASETHGARGIPEGEQSVPAPNKAITRLNKSIDRLTARAQAAGGRVPKEVAVLERQRDALVARIQSQGERIQAHTDIRNAAADRLTELRNHVAPPDEGAPGKSASQMARSTPALDNPEVQGLKDQIARAQDRLAVLPTEAATRNGTSVISSQMNDEINSLRQTIADSRAKLADAAVQEKPNAALNRGVNLAYSVRDIQDATQRIAEQQREQAKTIIEKQKLDTRIETGDTQSAKMQTKYAQVAAKRTEQLSKALETQPVSQWPRALQPAGGAYMRMIEEAKSNPELKTLVGDAEPTWRGFMQHAVALGMDPKYVADMTPDQVRGLMRQSPGFELGEQAVAGARKEYNSTLGKLDAADQSIEAFLAARGAMHQEIAQNMMAGYMKDNFAVPVKAGNVVSNDLVSFDPANKFNIEPREANGSWRAPKDGYVIPKTLAGAIVRANKDYNHWFQTANKYALNPWRNAVITASPQFYLNHTIGHAVLATIEGVKLNDWSKAWDDYKAKDPHGIYASLSGHSAVGQGTSLEPTLEGASGVRDAMARTEGGPVAKAGAATHAVASKLHGITNFVDTMARAATYITKKEAGYSDAEALNKAVSNLVDYNDLSPFEQQVVRAVVPFYSFQKSILKIVAKFPMDHPAVLGVAANLGRVNQQQLSDRFGASFPRGYAGLIDTGGGGAINTHGINPFKDATSLASLDGIVQALNPAMAIALRSGLNAPSGGYVQGRKVDAYGNLVPDVNVVDEIKDQASFLPFVNEATSIAGGGKGPVRGSLAKLGLNTYSPDEMTKLVERIKGSQSAAASGSPFAKKKTSSLFG